MGHCGGVRGQSLGPAQADRELDHLELIQHREGFGFAALDLEAESRARAFALALEDLPIGVVLGRKPRYQTAATLAWPRRKSATLRAPSAAAVILSFRVSSDRINIQPVLGSHIVPRIVRMPRIGSSAWAAPEQPPAIRSEWPPTYLVSDVTTRSAPCSSGVWYKGPSIVLSTMTTGRFPSSPLRPPASSLARPMSTRPLVGLAGVSRKSAATGPMARARFTAPSIALVPPSAGNSIETTSNCGRILSRRKSVPP